MSKARVLAVKGDELIIDYGKFELPYIPGPYLQENNTIYKLNEDGSNIFSMSIQGGYLRQFKAYPRILQSQGSIRTPEQMLQATTGYVLKACNMHDKLVSALKELYYDSIASDFNEYWASYKNAEAIIAEAEQKDTHQWT